MVGDPRATAASLGLDTWKFNLQKKLANGWDDDGIMAALQLLATADAAAKGAERQPEYRLEQLLVLVAHRGRP
jgi:DNA polymerase-3 subunit delta